MEDTFAPSITAQLWTTGYDATSIFLNHPYLLTFGEDRVDIWRMGPNLLPEHTARVDDMPYLPQSDEKPGIVIDAGRTAAVIPARTMLQIIHLVTGELRYVALPGYFIPWTARCFGGCVLLATAQDENDVPPHGVSHITIVNITNEEDSIRHLSLPPHLQHREHTRTLSHSTFVPLVLTPAGDIIGASSEPYAKIMDVMRWRSPTNAQANQQPDAYIELPMCFNRGHCMEAEDTVWVDDNTFAFCVFEFVKDVIANGRCSQEVVYAIDAESFTVRWKAEPIFGWACTLRFVPALGVVVAIGRNKIQPDDSTYYFQDVTWVAVLDKKTGACRRVEIINHDEAGAPVLKCTISEGSGDPTLVVAFTNGHYIISKLADVMDSGLPRGQDGLLTTKAFEEHVKVENVVVGDRILLMLLSEGSKSDSKVHSIPCISW